jgi:uncharacterized hydrophobic protein (TIGR00341 family)
MKSEFLLKLMALRLVEVVVPLSGAKIVEEIVKDQNVDRLPNIQLMEDRILVRFILEAEEAEAITEKFRESFDRLDGFRINLIALEATIPEHKPREEKEKELKKEQEKIAKNEIENDKDVGAATPSQSERTQLVGTTRNQTHENNEKIITSEIKTVKTKEKKDEKKKSSRISRDELYSRLSDAVKPNTAYFVLVALSVIVAAVGLVQNNAAIIIGAMVIAPLLAPNVALSLSTTLASRKLAGKALVALSLGLFLALGLSFVLGIFLHVDSTIPEIALRAKVGIGDVIVGLAAGAAASLFFSLGVGTALVGVTVAAALLPPLVVTGLLAGAGEVDLATQSLLLLVSNLIGINLAGTVVFILQGVWPGSWWEEKKAKRTALSAVIIWIILFLVLVLILLVSENIIKF